jgi:hypothetical protein
LSGYQVVGQNIKTEKNVFIMQNIEQLMEEASA